MALIAGQTWWASLQDRRLSLATENTSALAAVRGLEEHANQILHNANRSIDDTVDAIHSRNRNILADPAALRQILRQQKSDIPFLQSIRYLDLQGISQVTSLAENPAPINVSDRQYTRFLNAHPQQLESAIGQPVKSRYDGQWVIPVARNLFDADGHRLGIIGAYILVNYFEHFYQRVAHDNQAIVALVSDNGFVLIRTPFDSRYVDANISTSATMQRIRSGAIEGWFEGQPAVGPSQARLYAYRRFADFPVSAVYARNRNDVLRAWRQRTTDRVLFATVAIACIMFLTTLLARHIRRLQRTGRDLQASENRYRILYEGGNDAVLLWDRQQIYVDGNQAALKLFDLPDKQHLVGRAVGAFSPPQQNDGVSTQASRQRRTNAALNGEIQHFEWAIYRDGKPYYNEVTLSRAEIDGQPLVLAVFHDINSRKRAQALHSGQNHVLHLIAAGEDLHDTLTQITCFVERYAPHARCAILLVDDTKTSFSDCIATNPQPLQTEVLHGMPIVSGNGCCSEAVLSRCPVIVEEIDTDPLMSGLLQRAGTLPFASSGSWPVMGRHGEILGVLTFFYREKQTPDKDDMQLIGISTDLAGIAIESRKAEERIMRLAHYDELSGLPNRFLFIQHLNKALAHAEREQRPVAIMFLDLDRFKNINDTFGHDTGDQVLRESAARMRASLRDEDIIARVGGDEFLALIENYQDPVRLGEIAQRLLLEAAEPFNIAGHDYQLSVSIGIATYPNDGSDAQTLLKNADIAMYRAKATGKNNYQFYSAEMNTHTVMRAALEAGLRRALEQREFVVHYQPKVEIDTGRIIGAEALVRWQHPERGLIFPGEFIALAEDAGLIGQLGMLVLDIVCHDAAALCQQGLACGRIAINLSASQFNQPDLLQQMQRTIAASGITPECLEFEITESMVMHNHQQAIALMDGIRRLGFTLSIDDFGTGYSSLAYLKRFPVNSLKIDKSFIDDIPYGPNDSAIVQAIIAMAHTLGLEVIAEGVETKIQLDTLRQFDCDMYQGFYFSKAVPVAEYRARIADQARLARQAQLTQDADTSG